MKKFFKNKVAQAALGLMLIVGPALAYNDGNLPPGSNIGGHLVATVANKLSDFASTTSAQLASVVSDHVGGGFLYFTGGALGTPASGIATNLTGSAAGLNAGTATALQTGRTINGVTFDGTANITAPAAAGTLTGTTLASNVVSSSLTSVGTLANLTVTNPINGSVTGGAGAAPAGTLTGTTLASNVVTSSLTSVGTLGTLTVTAPISGSITGNAATATALQTGRAINGVTFDGTAPITVTAAAGTVTGTTLASNVLTSSLTTVGTIGAGTWQGTPVADGFIASAATWNAKQAALPAGTTTTVLHGNASGSPAYGAVATADMAAGTANSLLGYSGAGAASGVTIGSGLSLAGGTLTSTGSGGTVTTASVVSANGLAGTVANPTTTPAITLSTTVNGIAKGNGTALSAATSGTDYSAGTSGLATGILKSTTTTGGLTIAVAGDFPTLNQNTTGTAAFATALGTAGTTTTVLHGNASGAPSYGAVALGTDVSGTLLAAQFPAQTGDVTNSAGSLANTISNLAVTNAKIANSTIDLTAKVTGLLPLANGGGAGATAQASMLNLTGNRFLSATATASDIQTAFDAVATINSGTRQHGTVYLYPNTTYNLGTGLKLETEYVDLDCQGSVLNFSTLSTSGTGILVQNTLGIPETGAYINENGVFKGCNIIGDPTASGAGYNTTHGVVVQGTPELTVTLNGSISSGASSLVLSSATNFPTVMISIQIDSEVMLVTCPTTSCTINQRGAQGTSAAAHSNGANIISWHIASTVFDIPHIHYFNKGFDIGDSAFAITINSPFFADNFYGIYAAAATNTAQAENIRFNDGDIYNNAVGVYAEHQILRFKGTSWDYQTSRTMDIHLGSRIEQNEGHIEFNYGNTAGQTNNPIKLTDADSSLLMTNTTVHYAGSTTTRYWNALIVGDNNTQHIDLDNIMLDNVGFSTANNTSDDSLITSTNTNHNNVSVTPQVTMRNVSTKLYSTGTADLPACPSYDAGANFWPNGPGYTYGEWILGGRATYTSNIVVSAVGTDSGVVPKDGDTMLKITGTGHLYVTLKTSPHKKMAWAAFANGGNAVGTVTVTEQYSTVNPAYNGSSAITSIHDSRGQVSSTYSFPTITTNQWTQMSWKNTEASPNVPNFQSEYVTLDFDFTSMSSGAFYIDQACFGNFGFNMMADQPVFAANDNFYILERNRA